MMRQILVATFVILVGAATGAAAPIGMVVDQHNPFDVSQGSFGIALENGMGPTGRIAQVFTPSVPMLDVFSFYFVDGNEDNGLGVSAYVEILTLEPRVVIAQSRVVEMPDNFGVTHSFNDGAETFFLFDTRVILEPGVQYAARIQKDSGDVFRVRGGRAYGYPGGYYLPTFNSVDDLFFSSGYLVPEPSTCSLALVAIVVAATAALAKFLSRRCNEFSRFSRCNRQALAG